jgi:hypothetical protein
MMNKHSNVDDIDFVIKRLPPRYYLVEIEEHCAEAPDHVVSCGKKGV